MYTLEKIEWGDITIFDRLWRQTSTCLYERRSEEYLTVAPIDQYKHCVLLYDLFTNESNTPLKSSWSSYMH